MSATCLFMNPTEVLLEDFKDLLSCCSCHEAPMLPPVSTCRSGHSICSNCRNRLKICNSCEEPLSGRNLPLETTIMILLQYMAKAPTVLEDHGSVGVEEKLEEDGLNPSATNACRLAAKRMSHVVARDCQSQLLVSGRTFLCPFPCNAKITGPGLYRHFGFQHPEVYVGTMYKNRPFSIFIPREHLDQLNEESPTRCIYFLVVRVGDQECMKEHKIMDIKSVRAAELLSMSHNMSYMLKQRTYLALLSVHRLKDPEVYALWVTALYDFTPVKYTLRYHNRSDSVSYQGRPVSILAPAPVAEGGGCLMLTSAMVKRDFQLHPNHLELTLFFQLEFPFPPDLPDVPSTASPISNLVDL